MEGAARCSSTGLGRTATCLLASAQREQIPGLVPAGHDKGRHHERPQPGSRSSHTLVGREILTANRAGLLPTEWSIRAARCR